MVGGSKGPFADTYERAVEVRDHDLLRSFRVPIAYGLYEGPVLTKAFSAHRRALVGSFEGHQN